MQPAFSMWPPQEAEAFFHFPPKQSRYISVLFKGSPMKGVRDWVRNSNVPLKGFERECATPCTDRHSLEWMKAFGSVGFIFDSDVSAYVNVYNSKMALITFAYCIYIYITDEIYHDMKHEKKLSLLAGQIECFNNLRLFAETDCVRIFELRDFLLIFIIKKTNFCL